jgi:AcrR family transcriptional regulator
MEAVAKLSGAGKPTIYRYWANSHELAMAALMQSVPTVTPVDENLSPLEAIRHLLYQISETFTHATGRYVANLLASAHEDSDMAKAFRSHFIQKQRKEAERICDRAIEDGSLAEGFNTTIGMDLIFGAILYRLVMTGEPVDKGYMDKLVTVLAGTAK